MDAMDAMDVMDVMEREPLRLACSALLMKLIQLLYYSVWLARPETAHERMVFARRSCSFRANRVE